MGCGGSKKSDDNTGPGVTQDDTQLIEAVLPDAVRSLVIEKDEGLYFNMEVQSFLVQTSKMLFESMEGLGTSEAALIRGLVLTSPQFKKQLRAVFEERHCSSGQTLDSWLKGETSMDFKKAVVSMAQDPADMDADTLYGAMKGLGTDDNCLVRTLTTRDHLHLCRVRERFEAKGEGTLEKWIKGDTSWDFKNVLLALQDRATFVAQEIHESIAGWGTDDKKLVRLISGLKRNKHVKRIIGKYEALDTTGVMRNLIEEIKEQCCGVGVEDVKEAYERLYGKSLIDAVKADTSFSYQKLCVTCLEHEGEQNARFIKEALDNGMIGGLGTNDSKLVAVLVTRSPAAREELAAEYKKQYGKTVQEAVAGDTSGGYAKTLDAILTPRPEYIAENINLAWRHGTNTDELALCRLLVNRPPQVLISIQEAYQRMYGKALIDDVAAQTSGWFQSTLCYILNEAYMPQLRMNHDLLDYVVDVDNFMNKAFPADQLPREISQTVNGVFGCWNAALFLKGDVRGTLEVAAKDILTSMKGIGTDEAMLIRNLYNVPPQFRAELRKVFKEKCCEGDQTIESWIKGDTSFDFETVCLELTKTPRESDADAIRGAVTGLGTDDTCLQRTLALLPAMDMSSLLATYLERDPNGKSMVDAIEGDTSWDYKETLVALTDPAKYVAQELHDAVKVWYGTDDSKLIRLVAGLRRNEKAKEILTRYEALDTTGLLRPLLEELKHELGGPSLTEVKEAYKRQFDKTLEEAISGDTSFDYKNLLLALVEDQGKRDARYLYEAIKNDGWVLGTNDSKLIAMLVLRTRHERAELARCYEEEYKTAATAAVKGDTSGWYCECLLTLLKPLAEALADACNKAMAGLGTDEAALIRILSFHTKKDLRELQDAYKAKYGKPLADAVASETSGWFAKCLAYILTQALTDNILIDETRCLKRKDVDADYSAVPKAETNGENDAAQQEPATKEPYKGGVYAKIDPDSIDYGISEENGH
eukprot:gnl/MRDRNA2_/MRDRNA2_28798_c0_seq1.p1 gnl/MRDRNA2_/MRDRNA2_28798_c0~~gnl/MRDRNA2_/MRDRNA2_28798_c0_seq1.p1  ORF type:complete len:986 (-),score=214.51 gnl/MRDRNA2_/MRDRNA2_28798_c0_seq1:67-3024(-)